jgi:hypothetical protein
MYIYIYIYVYTYLYILVYIYIYIYRITSYMLKNSTYICVKFAGKMLHTVRSAMLEMYRVLSAISISSCALSRLSSAAVCAMSRASPRFACILFNCWHCPTPPFVAYLLTNHSLTNLIYFGQLHVWMRRDDTFSPPGLSHKPCLRRLVKWSRRVAKVNSMGSILPALRHPQAPHPPGILLKHPHQLPETLNQATRVQ